MRINRQRKSIHTQCQQKRQILLRQQQEKKNIQIKSSTSQQSTPTNQLQEFNYPGA